MLHLMLSEVTYVEVEPQSLLQRIALPCGILAIIVLVLGYSLVLQRRGLKRQAEAMRSVEETMELSRRSIQLGEKGLQLQHEQVRLLRKIAGEPPGQDELDPSQPPWIQAR